jgi:hypothetical protein
MISFPIVFSSLSVGMQRLMVRPASRFARTSSCMSQNSLWWKVLVSSQREMR